MNVCGVCMDKLFLCIFFFWHAVLLSEEFSEPKQFKEFGSNVGAQQVVDVVQPWVGSTPNEIAPDSIPLGSLVGKTFFIPDENRFATREIGRKVPTSEPQVLVEGWVGPFLNELAPGAISLGSLSNRKSMPKRPRIKGPIEKAILANDYSVFASTRPYYTTNVLRVKNEEQGAGGWENTVGGSIAFPKVEMGSYISMIPRLDFILLSSAYEKMENNMHETLGFVFGLGKGGLSFELPKGVTLGTSLEYNHLSNLTSGKKTFDAWVPSLTVSKMFEVGETAALMLSASTRYSFTRKVMEVSLPGTFDDDGDNFQAGFNISYMEFLGKDGQFMLMPSFGMSRTEHLKHQKKGVVHLTTTFGFNASWQIKEWLSLDFGTLMSFNQSNEKVEDNPGAEYEAVDFGTTLMTNYFF